MRRRDSSEEAETVKGNWGDMEPKERAVPRRSVDMVQRADKALFADPALPDSLMPGCW
jgi:hypothetical protein